MKFRKKPIIIEARQYNGKNAEELVEWMKTGSLINLGKPVLIIYTLEGQLAASVGDWIIKGVKGEFYPCKPDIFEETYEEIEE